MKRLFVKCTLVLLPCLFASTAYSQLLLTSYDSHLDAPAGLEEYLESEKVLRYRFVKIDVDHLWSLFESFRDADDPDNIDPLLLNLFDGLLVELRYGKVHHRYWWSQASLHASVSGSDPEVAGVANVQLRRGESANFSIKLAGDVYYVGPVGDGPIHVVWQPDPAKMPNLD